MSDCNFCDVETDCHYPFKPCDCVHKRKFWDAERRKEYDLKNLPDELKDVNNVLRRGRSTMVKLTARSKLK